MRGQVKKFNGKQSANWDKKFTLTPWLKYTLNFRNSINNLIINFASPTHIYTHKSICFRHKPSIDSHKNRDWFRCHWTLRCIGRFAKQYDSSGLHVSSASWHTRLDMDWHASTVLHRWGVFDSHPYTLQNIRISDWIDLITDMRFTKEKWGNPYWIHSFFNSLYQTNIYGFCSLFQTYFLCLPFWFWLCKLTAWKSQNRWSSFWKSQLHYFVGC